jgi:putative ABC transport system permease protein
VTALVAWRILTYEPGRSALAVGGIFVAILLIFLQIGFYVSVPQSGMLYYDAMRFDLMLTSSSYLFEPRPSTFPRRQLYRALALPEVARVMPVYHSYGRWLNNRAALTRDVFVTGFNPADPVFKAKSVEQQTGKLTRTDTILVDTATRPQFGPLTPGRIVEIDQRAVEIAGTYNLGTGLFAPGTILTSDVNFIRIFTNQELSDVNLGLVKLNPGADPKRVAGQLRSILPANTRVFTRNELTVYEMGYWLKFTSAGLIFGFGATIAFVVGLVILNQSLSVQFTRYLPQYATLKAMGYTDRYLVKIAVVLATMMSMIGYVFAAAMAIVLYAVIQRITLLPTEMTSARIFGVFAAVWAMSVICALLSLKILRRADPVDLF